MERLTSAELRPASGHTDPAVEGDYYGHMLLSHFDRTDALYLWTGRISDWPVLTNGKRSKSMSSKHFDQGYPL